MDHDIPRLQCLNKPTKRHMADLFKQAVEDGIQRKVPFVMAHRVGMLALVEEMNKKGKMPDKEWLLILLAKVPGRSCPLFAKGYEPPKKPAPNRTDVQIPNQDAFYTNLSKVSPSPSNQFCQDRLFCVCQIFAVFSLQ